jgi:hypothetical protein
MTCLRTLAVVIVFLMCASIVAGAPSSAGRDLTTTSEPGDLCKNGHPTYYWTLDDWFAGEESFSVLCDQAERGGCEGGWKPISVTMYLYWEEKNSCALTVQAELHEADPRHPDRSARGPLIVASEIREVGPFKPAGLWAVTLPMPLDAPIVDGPCFATIRFLDTCDELPAVVAAPGACEAGRSWRKRSAGWKDMSGLELPGNLSAFATFECQLRQEEDPVAWSTIKSMYDKDE